MSIADQLTPEEKAELLKTNERKEQEIENNDGQVDPQALLKEAEAAILKVENDPSNRANRKAAYICIAALPGDERDIKITEMFKILKPLGISKTTIRSEVEKFIPNTERHNNDDEREPQADILINIATTNAFLFHDETKDSFANMEINGHRETWPLRSKFFRQWLVRQYYQQTEKSPNSEAVRQALGVIEAKAVFDGPEHKLNLRVAEYDGAIWYDLANEKWQAVKITADGWEVVDDPPIMFRRFKNTAPQVLPERGGCLELLKRYINFKNDNDWLLMYACDAAFLIPGVPHPIPIFYGDKGSAKTTAQRVIRKIADPAHRDTMTLPTDKNEMALLLMTNYAPCFDNLDGLQAWQSDMLCQAATGGGISKRELYSDMDEVILSFLRCPMLNGINLVASRDDLLDRSILFRLERIDEDQRKEESAFWQEFEKDRPFILGALFDTISKAMKIHSTVKLDRLPRMADFARWGYAITEAIGGSGEKFMNVYYQNIAGAVEEAVLADQVSASILEFMNDKGQWEGTSTDLLKFLSDLPDIDTKAKSWPKKSHTLTRRINKMKSALADSGIKAEVWRTGTKRIISLRTLRVTNIASQASQASEPRENRHSNNDAFESEASQKRHSVTKASQHEPRENRHFDANDANDAFLSTPGGSVTNIKKNDDDLKEVTL